MDLFSLDCLFTPTLCSQYDNAFNPFWHIILGFKSRRYYPVLIQCTSMKYPCLEYYLLYIYWYLWSRRINKYIFANNSSLHIFWNDKEGYTTQLPFMAWLCLLPFPKLKIIGNQNSYMTIRHYQRNNTNVKMVYMSISFSFSLYKYGGGGGG